MKTVILSLDRMLQFPPDTSNDYDDEEYINKRKKLLRSILCAMENELTERQQECLWKRMQGEKITDIAKDLNLGKSTVDQHIYAGLNKLKKIYRYIDI